MGFPYLAPIKGWVKNVLEEREASYSKGGNTNPSINHLKMPWAVLTSAAKVTNVSGMKDNVSAAERELAFQNLVKENSTNSKDYFGCIIRNNINSPELSYQTAETIVGVDFKGDYIKVLGETNRRVSTPIIESIDVDTDGANNTLKTAKVSIKCFTLKQFEMFELFFCKPGMNVLVEWGDNTLDVYRGNKKPADAYSNSAYVSGQLFDKTNYNTFIEKFSDYYRFNTTSLKLFQKHVEKALGSYDMVAGKVTDYSFSIDESGVYTVSLDISQGNQMSLAIPVNIGNKKSTLGVQSTDGTLPWEQWVSQVTADLNLEAAVFKANTSKEEVEKEFFNWGKINDTKEDETASTESYISFRFILKQLMNYALSDSGAYTKDKTFFIPIPEYDVDGSPKEYIPIRSHKNIISTNKDIIFPNAKMVSFRGPIQTNKESDVIQISSQPIDGSINGYSVNENKKIKNSDGNELNPTNDKDGNTCGNALNIFINYKIIAQAWKASYDRRDFLSSILNTINGASLGKFRLTYNSISEGTTATVMDWTSTSDAPIEEKGIYRFKANTLESNVREFSFNFEMSNLVAGRTVFNAQRFLTNALKELKPPKAQGDVPLPTGIYKEFDNSLMSNADGFFSINMIDLKALEKNYQDAVKSNTVPEDEKKEETKNEAKNYTDIIAQKSIKFKISKNNIKPLIFTDVDLIKTYIAAPESDKKSTLSPIEVSLMVDGINGFSCGEYFKINGVPEIYNQIGVFQITNVKHQVSSNGWVTSIEAQHRITPKNK
jgi:hypothetical protein